MIDGDSSGDQPTRRPWPQAEHFAILAAFWSAFVIYGSLTPFGYEPHAAAEAVEFLRQLLTQPLVPASKGDWVTNVLLLVPFGFAVLGACVVDRNRAHRRWIAIGITLALGLGLSLAVETAQFWFPPRYPSMSDVVAQTIGNVIGMGVWLMAGQSLTDWMRRQSADGAGRAVALLQAYVAAVFVLSLLPLDLTIRPGDLWDKYQAGFILLVPFERWNWGIDQLIVALLDAAAMWPIGTLAALWPHRISAGRQEAAIRTMAAIGFVALIEFLQLFVRSRHCDVTDVILGALGVMGGIWVAQQWPSEQGRESDRSWLPVACLIVVGLLLIAAFLTPVARVAGNAEAVERIAEMFRVPLEVLRHGDPLTMAANVLRKLLLFGVFGWLIRITREGTATASQLRSLVVCGALAGLLAATIEVAQGWLLPHVPDVTDIIWGALGGGLGAYLGPSTPITNP